MLQLTQRRVRPGMSRMAVFGFDKRQGRRASTKKYNRNRHCKKQFIPCDKNPIDANFRKKSGFTAVTLVISSGKIKIMHFMPQVTS